jgi:hypothetical protein
MSKIPVDVFYALIAAAGGAAKHLNEYLHQQEEFAWPKLLANIIVSGFSGYVFTSVVIGFNPEWAIPAAGIGGYMGGNAMDYLFTILSKRVSIKQDE